MKKVFAFIGVSVLTVAIALTISGQGLKISQYPQTATPQPQFLFIMADPNQTNWAIRYDNLRVAILTGVTVDLTQATNNDIAYSNALSSFIVSLVQSSTNNISLQSATNNDILYSNALSAFTVSWVNGATNLVLHGFIAALGGSGTNIFLYGTNIVTEFDITTLVATNAYYATNWPPPAAPLDYGQMFQGNSNGIIYWVMSKQNALTWTKTNLMASP